ncbi:hypothetical protein CDG81_10075 [Actinopolyspora erythraea]|uniref:DUF4175 domain-containing protein n=1 Tax=Actinopolyspora erythraea TaxID=414996 RepID=A0A099D6N6_9ACTN|nr:hypothetical protein [Actinopolyspora erythraea]ASU78569.1 hypothetical protein CDG81_10075 [Actinopolyspora erythraea]KGI81571.1 hypothetical protein IL38_10075 [Actinopolyspora erythraea]
MKKPVITRNDIYIAAAGPAAGLLVAMFTLHWDWLFAGILITAIALVWARLRRAGTDWSVRAGLFALLVGLLLWLWLDDARWAILGMFPLVFVFIRKLATAVEQRR